MMEVNVTINENEVMVRPSGRIDAKTSEDFQEECLKVIDKADSFVIDFTDVEYVSSAGLRVIVLLKQIQDKKLRSFKLCNINEIVREVMDAVGFLDFLTIV